MFTATLRSMLAHRLRLVLTTASIALGIAFLAGTLMLTDTMRLAFDQLFGTVSSGTDAVVRQEAAYDATAGVGLDRRPLPATVLAEVASVDGVAAAEGSVRGYALLTDEGGRAVLTSGGAPTMGYSLPTDGGLRGEVHLRSGRAPDGPDEVAVDATSAEEHAIDLGSTISVLLRGPTQDFTVVGTVAYGDEGDLGGTTAAYFDTATAQAVLGAPGAFDEVQVRASEGVSDRELADRLSEVLPTGVEAVTGATVARESADAISAQFSFLEAMLMAFAGISLFVGAFIIWNTFTMVVTQRSREIALLRALGATRGQVQRSLLTEAVLLGLAASAVGIVLGAGVATGLHALMDVLGFSLPTTSLQVRPRTVVVSLLVGTTVTVAAALVPARRATRVLPVEALRDATPGARGPSTVRAAVGSVLTLGGVAAVLVGLYADVSTSLPVLLGILTTLCGVITLSPLAVRPLVRVVGAPLRLRGVAGDLARQNAVRNPRRTAATAAALMIGLALVVGTGVFASSLKASFGTVLGDSTDADLFLTGASAQSDGFSPEVAEVVADVPGVAVVSATGWGAARFEGVDGSYSAVDPATLERVLDVGMTSGSVASLDADGVLVAAGTAASHGWEVGDTVAVEFAATGLQELEVRGTYDGSSFLDTDYLLSRSGQQAAEADRLDTRALVVVDDGADPVAVQDRISAALADHPDAKVLDQAQFEQELAGTVDQLLTFVSVMLALAVVIALLGIVNTLALSVHERTRELGLLRAVGMTRAQVRSMVRWESVVISLVGAGVGATLGIGLGLALAQAMQDQGITEVAVPAVQVALCVLAAAAAGVLAAVGPARSAARVDVLRAVVTD